MEKDKILCPLLLAASFNGFVKFEGSHIQDGVLYWYFSTKDKSKKFIDKFATKTEQHIPAKDLFEAIGTFWKQINQLKEEKARYETHKVLKMKNKEYGKS